MGLGCGGEALRWKDWTSGKSKVPDSRWWDAKEI